MAISSPHERYLARLLEMGYTRAGAIEALRSTNNSGIEAAVAYLSSHPEIQVAGPEEPAPEEQVAPVNSSSPSSAQSRSTRSGRTRREGQSQTREKSRTPKIGSGGLSGFLKRKTGSKKKDGSAKNASSVSDPLNADSSSSDTSNISVSAPKTGQDSSSTAATTTTTRTTTTTTAPESAPNSTPPSIDLPGCDAAGCPSAKKVRTSSEAINGLSLDPRGGGASATNSASSSSQPSIHKHDAEMSPQYYSDYSDDELYDYSEEYDEDTDDGDEGEDGNEFFDFDDILGNTSNSMTMDENELMKNEAAEEQVVADICKVSREVAGLLLRSFRYDKQKLIESYIEDKDKVLRDAGTSLEEESGKKALLSNTCCICFDDFTEDELCALSCGHGCCRECWRGFLDMKIKEGEVDRIGCPSFKCPLAMTNESIRELVDQSTFERYKKFLTNKFVKDKTDIVWCPAPGCNLVVNVDSANGTMVACKCGYTFCYDCKEHNHAPASCDQVRLWKKKCQDDSETYNWISVNTKECPKCHTCIEKNGGCNHMSCKTCKHQWCWVCMGDWSGHSSYYSCNRYEPKAAENRSKQKQSLERYLHYYSRYKNHEESLKKEAELRASVDEKIGLIQEEDPNWVDTPLLLKSVKQLSACRSALRWTYVFAYYLSDGPEKNLFEFLQQELEATTERLSGLLEGEITSAERIPIIDLTRLAGAKLTKLIDGVEAGLIPSSR